MSRFSEHVTTYGIETKGDEYGAKKTLESEGRERPETPQNLFKYRESYYEVGTSRAHPGIYGDSIPHHRGGFGIKNLKEEYAKDLLGIGKPPSKELQEDIKKDVATLGRSSTYGTKFPEHTQEKKFRFGIPTNMSENAKNLIYASETKKDPEVMEKERSLYRKSHGAYEPGEQVRRGYKWDKIGGNPNSYSFGKKVVGNYAVGDCLGIEGVGKIISSKVHNFNKLTQTKLGRGKKGEVDVNQTFGTAILKDEWGARECITGQYSPAEQMPDEDVGRCSKKSKIEGIEDMVFGQTKFRDEVNAKVALRPGKFIDLGVTERDFDSVFPKDELKEIILDAGVVGNESEFEEIYEASVKYFGKELEMLKVRDHVDPKVDGCTMEIFQRVLFKKLESTV